MRTILSTGAFLGLVLAAVSAFARDEGQVVNEALGRSTRCGCSECRQVARILGSAPVCVIVQR